MTAIIIIISILLGLALGFFINAGFVWVVYWGLNAIGVHTIAGWTVEFSWPLAILFTLICLLISGFFANAKR